MSRKTKWRGIILNKNNIDEYMNDLYEDTKGQYITQGVSFNKNDTFQMNLLKNALISHGSFSGFVKHLMHSYFEKNNENTGDVWIPNPTTEEVAPPPVVEAIQEQEESIEQPDIVVEVEVEKPQQEVQPTPPVSLVVSEETVKDTKNKENKRKPLIRNGAGSLSEALLKPKAHE